MFDPPGGSRGKAAMKTKGEIEAEISDAMVKFEVEYMARGPKETQAYLIDDMVLIRLKGVLARTEEQLSKRVDGVELIKKVRSSLIESTKLILSQVIGDITGAKVLSLHTDISTISGERVIILTLDRDLEKAVPRKKTC